MSKFRNRSRISRKSRWDAWRQQAARAYFERFRELREFFIVVVETGLRAWTDLRNLKWSTIDFGGGFIRVLTQKTQREAEIPISAACREAGGRETAAARLSYGSRRRRMKRVIEVARSCGAVMAPFAALALPKCPLCLLPVLALAGVALPSGAGVNWLIVLVTALSLGTFIVVSQALWSRVLAVFAAPLIAGGRVLTLEPAYWLGVALLVAAAVIHIQRIASRRRAGSCAAGVRCAG